jgi:hypothetical protein
MKFVLLIYQGNTPLPGSDRWKALSEAEQKAICVDYAELNKTEVTVGLPLGCGTRRGGAAEVRPANKYESSIRCALRRGPRIRALTRQSRGRMV